MLEYYEVSSLVHTRTNKGTKVIVFHNLAITNQTREREVSAAATRLCVHLFGLHVGPTNRWRRRVESVGESRCKAGRDFASTLTPERCYSATYVCPFSSSFIRESWFSTAYMIFEGPE